MNSSDLPKSYGDASTLKDKHLLDSTGIFAGTSVMTLYGLLSVEYLSPGDRVVTRSGAVILREILSGRVCTETYAIRSDVLGLFDSEKEMALPADQKILIRDQLAKQLTGKNYALIPASQLAPLNGVSRRDAMSLQMYSLIFENDEICYADGLELLCPANPKRSDSIALI